MGRNKSKRETWLDCDSLMWPFSTTTTDVVSTNLIIILLYASSQAVDTKHSYDSKHRLDNGQSLIYRCDEIPSASSLSIFLFCVSSSSFCFLGYSANVSSMTQCGCNHKSSYVIPWTHFTIIYKTSFNYLSLMIDITFNSFVVLFSLHVVTLDTTFVPQLTLHPSLSFSAFPWKVAMERWSINN